MGADLCALISPSPLIYQNKRMSLHQRWIWEIPSIFLFQDAVQVGFATAVCSVCNSRALWTLRALQWKLTLHRQFLFYCISADLKRTAWKLISYWQSSDLLFQKNNAHHFRFWNEWKSSQAISWIAVEPNHWLIHDVKEYRLCVLMGCCFSQAHSQPGSLLTGRRRQAHLSFIETLGGCHHCITLQHTVTQSRYHCVYISAVTQYTSHIL